MERNKLFRIGATYFLFLFLLFRSIYQNSINDSIDRIIFFVAIIVIFTALNFYENNTTQKKDYSNLGFLIFSIVTSSYIIIKNSVFGNTSVLILIYKLYFYIIFIGDSVFRPSIIHKKLDKYGTYGELLIFLPLIILIIIIVYLNQ